MEFKITELGLIPTHWEVRNSSEIFDEITDGTHDTPTKMEKGYPLITSKHLKGGKILFDNCDYFISDSDYNIINKRSRVDKYDILFSMIGTIGEVSVVNTDNRFAIKNIGLFKSNDYDRSLFYYFWFQTDLFKTIINNNSNGSTQKYYSLYQLRNSPIIYPPFSEQKKIAHILSKIQQAIELQDKIIKNTQELKKALMQKLFTKGLNGETQKQTEIGLVPESWEVKPFIDFVLLQRGKDLSKDKFKEGIYPVMGSNGIIGYHSEYFVKSPGITVGRSGSCGSTHYIGTDFWAHNTTLYVKDFRNSIPLYVYYKLEYLDLAKYKSGVSVPTLNRNSFSNLLISIPQKDEQTAIAAILNHFDEHIKNQETKSQFLKELFQNSLNKLMSGKIRVKDVELDLEIN